MVFKAGSTQDEKTGRLTKLKRHAAESINTEKFKECLMRAHELRESHSLNVPKTLFVAAALASAALAPLSLK